MAEFQITSWRDLPSMVTARDGNAVAKVQLASRFQEAIDEAAMRLGETSSDEYMAGWTRGAWTLGVAEPASLAAEVVTRLESEWTDEAVATFLDSLSQGS